MSETTLDNQSRDLNVSPLEYALSVVETTSHSNVHFLPEEPSEKILQEIMRLTHLNSVDEARDYYKTLLVTLKKHS